MNTRRLFLPALIPVALIALALLTACGSSGTTKSQAFAPIFTSTPVTAATQDVVYTYQLAAVDPAGGVCRDQFSHGCLPQWKHHHLDANRRTIPRAQQLRGDGN
ncbi:MAG: hypothetical protein WA718_10145 [Terriglobales bacterium]